MAELTESEIKILEVLQEDGRITNQALSDRVGLSSAPCWRRVQALQKNGVIRGYAAQLDPGKVGIRITAYAHIQLQRHSEEHVEDFERAVQNIPEIMECYAVTGEADYLIKVMVRDVSEYDRFLHEFIFRIPGVAQVHSNLALREIKYKTVIPLRPRQELT